MHKVDSSSPFSLFSSLADALSPLLPPCREAELDFTYWRIHLFLSPSLECEHFPLNFSEQNR